VTRPSLSGAEVNGLLGHWEAVSPETDSNKLRKPGTVDRAGAGYLGPQARGWGGVLVIKRDPPPLGLLSQESAVARGSRLGTPHADGAGQPGPRAPTKSARSPRDARCRLGIGDVSRESLDSVWRFSGALENEPARQVICQT
jgi:hypothetical protein